jgi:drug/metabolite transporter (DMT)-like permease
VRRDSTATSLLWSALVGLTITSLALPLFWAPIAPGDLWLFGLVGFLGAAGQAFLLMAFAEAEAGLLAPFGYLGLVFSALWGALFFGHWPDGFTVLGGAIITAAGVYVWWRERLAMRAG